MDENKSFVNIHVEIPEEFYDLAIGHLSEYPIAGIEEKTDELVVTMPSPFYNDTVRSMIIQDLHLVCPEASITSEETIPDKNWNEQWEQTISPIIINDKIAISPEWHIPSLNHEHIIAINPKMSFGTGHHATTRLVCSLLYDNLEKDSSWIDAGTGTGVLAILAIKLGASDVYAFDNDEWSIDNAKENIILNNCADKVLVEKKGLLEVQLKDCDGITANLYTHLLKPAFPKFFDALKKKCGCLLISGVLVYDKDEIIAEAEKAGFRLINSLQEDEWIAAHFKAGN